MRKVVFAIAVLAGCGASPNYSRVGADGGDVDVPIPGTGGMVGTGGTIGTGGTGGTGGTAASGGAGHGGIPGQGGSAVGGTTGTAGTPGTGGMAGAAGGTSGLGGVPATGGVAGGTAGGPGQGSGGATSTGGSTPTGGTPATGGATPTGGTPGTGGVAGGLGGGGQTATGGAAGAGGKAGAGGPTGGGGGGTSGGAGGTGPVVFNCAASTTPAAGLISDFTTGDASSWKWTSSNNVSGVIFSYHETASTAATTVATGQLRIMATITGAASYGGGGIILDTCAAAGTNTAIQFAVTGTNSCAVELQLQTYSQKPNTESPAGGCATGCGNKYPRASNLSVTTTPVKVTLSTMGMWTTAMASEIVGVQWQLTPPSGQTSCTADLRFDDIKFVP